MSLAGRFALHRRTGSAAELHGGWPPADTATPAIAVCRVTAPAIVLGSAQSPAVVDAAHAGRAGADIVVRRTGGGAVWVSPGAQVWVDLWLPRGDPRWDDDVVRASAWVGQAWRRALAGLGVAGLAVIDRPQSPTAWSALVCFAGLAPGEAYRQGRKATGLAQRRTAAGAWFHTVAYLTWRPAPLTEVLDLRADDRAGLLSELELGGVGLDELVAPAPGASLDSVEAAVVGAIGAPEGEST